MIAPSLKRKYKKSYMKLNIVPILDIVFILIFFLLTSSHFIKIFSIGSDLPIFSDKTQLNQKDKNLNLRIKISKSSVKIYTGDPSKLKKEFKLNNDEWSDNLNSYLLNLKNQYPFEETCLLEPHNNVPHQLIVRVMDSVREDLVTNDKRSLFNKLIFGNL